MHDKWKQAENGVTLRWGRQEVDSCNVFLSGATIVAYFQNHLRDILGSFRKHRWPSNRESIIK
jgi:hypothetical protein